MLAPPTPKGWRPHLGGNLGSATDLTAQSSTRTVRIYTIAFTHFPVIFKTEILDYISISGGSRIFPRGVRQLPKVLLFFNFFPENCMKMKEFGPPGGRVPGAPLRSANEYVVLLPNLTFEIVLQFHQTHIWLHGNWSPWRTLTLWVWQSWLCFCFKKCTNCRSSCMDLNGVTFSCVVAGKSRTSKYFEFQELHALLGIIGDILCGMMNPI